jgi:hypothetical protein
MFISTKEKQALTGRIEALEVRVEQLARSLNSLHDAKTMQPEPGQFKDAKAFKPLSAKQKAELARLKRNEYQRRYQQRKRQANVELN